MPHNRNRTKAIVASLFVFALTLPALGAADTSVELIEGSQPPYPKELVVQAESGVAKIRATIDEEGKVSKAEIESATHPACGISALETVKNWRFKPATKQGQPVPQTVVIPIVFKPSFEDRINAAAGRQVFVDIDALTDKVYTWGDVKRYFGLKKKENRVIPYPEDLRGSGIEGEIVVQFVLSPDGFVLNPKLVEIPDKELAPAALLHVVTLKFEKPKLNGAPIYVQQKVRLSCSEKPQPL